MESVKVNTKENYWGVTHFRIENKKTTGALSILHQPPAQLWIANNFGSQIHLLIV